MWCALVHRLSGWLIVLLGAGLAALPATGQYFRFGKNKVQYRAPAWYYVQSTHFDVYYYEGGEALADFTARAAEQAYAQIRHLFQHRIGRRIPLIVYQGHNDFAVTNAADLPAYAEGIGGVTELFKNRIAIPFTGDYRDYRRVIHHELVHAVLNDMFYGGSIQSIIQNNIQLHIPLWFNEGLAEYAALGWDTESDMYVREAVLEDHLAPIDRLDGFFAYRGGQSVWDYVAEQYGEEKIGEILQRLRTGRSVEAAFRRATGLSLDDLSERWHRALKEIYYPEMAAREKLDQLARPLITREHGYYNTSPALSPHGDRLAFITTRNGLFDVYLADADDGTILRRLVAGQTSRAFESLRILSPGLAWSPDGRHLALAVKSGAHEAIAVVDVHTLKTEHHPVPGVDQILAVAWSPDGRRLALSASARAQSDIYVLDLAGGAVVNLTNDVFSDHEPAWSPDGSAIVFHSDRGPHLELGTARAGDFAMIDHDFGQYDLYLLRPGGTRLRRLTFDEAWDERSARFGADPNRLLFLSDRNGVSNLYEKDLTTGAERPLTDLTVGLMQVALSADGQKAALVSLREGTPSIYILKAPFERDLGSEPLVPNVWAQRARTPDVTPAPAVSLARTTTHQANPFLRDATDGIPYARNRTQTVRPPLLAETLTDLFGHDDAPGTNGDRATDTLRTGGVRVDFRNYQFSSAFEEARRARFRDEVREDPGLLDPFRPRDNLDEDGNFKPRRYRLHFSPDLIYGTAGYDVLYGVQGITQMMFSDMLGNHRILVATNLLIDLRNSDYLIAYHYLPRRTDWRFTGFHTARLLADFRGSVPTYYRYRQYGASLTASYPFDKFHRLDADLSVVGVSQADVTDATVPTVTRTLFYPSVTFTRDVTVPGFLYPIGGSRLAINLAGAPFSFNRQQVRFLSVLADVRAYTSLDRGRYSFAFRLSGGTSLGPDRQLFYTSGVQNWINRDFDEANGFPIDDVTDFVFATPVLPLRGYAINSRNGSHFGLLNAEFRFPLVAAVLPGPLPILPFYNVQGVAFADVGAVWGGPDGRLRLFRDNPNGDRVLDDLLVGTGFGLRTLLLGYPARLDFAWPFDGRHFGARRLYFSIGFDF
ncbi:BamA/TamA family outer membrane protein [Rhodocaloribacter litoris]|uniref:peptidase MA family metallohydrolase n=1 Tax=Rhodocaloribacter litoris TaxID=2558931 RepID=UPI00141E6624|nr:BamA/TamA family outer membrane protein [Rhodocaloribacter litoris]QXD14171.1 BamA/TamA family outer membrane protein [Rhodocaloribacter litoris]